MQSYMELVEWLGRYRLGDATRVVGLLITIVGFTLTLWNVVRARSAAEQAREAAEARAEVRLSHTTVTLAHVVARMEELKLLHRQGLWQALPDRYSQLRRDLISVRHRSPYQTEAQAGRLQAGIMLLAKLEEGVDRSAQDGSVPAGIAEMNRRVSSGMEDLLRLLHELEAHEHERR